MLASHRGALLSYSFYHIISHTDYILVFYNVSWIIPQPVFLIPFLEDSFQWAGLPSVLRAGQSLLFKCWAILFLLGNLESVPTKLLLHKATTIVKLRQWQYKSFFTLLKYGKTIPQLSRSSRSPKIEVAWFYADAVQFCPRRIAILDMVCPDENIFFNYNIVNRYSSE